jgi:hypothetical protein
MTWFPFSTGQEFSSPSLHLEQLETHPESSPVGTAVRRPKRETDHSHRQSDEVKNVRPHRIATHLNGAQPVEEFLTFFATQTLIAAFKISRQSDLYSSKRIQSPILHSVYFTSILILQTRSSSVCSHISKDNY